MRVKLPEDKSMLDPRFCARPNVRLLALPLLVAGLLLLPGCESTGGGGGGFDTGEGLSCAVPSRCGAYHQANAEGLKRKILILFDQLEMAGGTPENRAGGLRVMQELEILLHDCPRLVLPQLLEQMERPVHQRQRGSIAAVVGWFPEGKSCSVPVLARLTNDPVPFVRYQAAAALLDLGDERGVPVLLDEAATNESENVRLRALQALSQFAGKEFRSRAEAQAHFGRR